MSTKQSAPQVITQKVLADFEQVKGRVLRVTHVIGYVEGDSVDFYLTAPAKLRVIGDAEGLVHWNGGWCDPYWDLKLVDPHPELEGVTSLWMHGHSYHVDGIQAEPAAFDLLDDDAQ